MRKFTGGALVIFVAISPAFGESTLPFEQTQLDRGETASSHAVTVTWQQGVLQGSAAGAAAQPGSHHSVQSPPQAGKGEAGGPAPEPKYPVQPVPDPYNPA